MYVNCYAICEGVREEVGSRDAPALKNTQFSTQNIFSKKKHLDIHTHTHSFSHKANPKVKTFKSVKAQ